MAPNFEVVDKLILSIKDGSFNGDVVPFLRYETELLDEASKITLGDPSEATEYLADGATVLNSMIFNLREDRYGAEERTSSQLELIEAALLNIYEHFLNLLTKIQQPLS